MNNNNVIKAIVKQPKIGVRIDFSRVFIENEAELRQKLYTYMLAQGYPVTAQMSLTQLINLLVGTVVAHYYVLVKTLVVEASDASVANKRLQLVTGASVTGKVLTLVGE